MKKLLLFLLMTPFLANAQVPAQVQASDPYRMLSPEDYEIYLETFNKCHKGTVGAALRTTIDPDIMKSAALNLSQIIMLNPHASKARMESNMVSPELYRQTNSAGFWVAFRDCYAGSSEARVILIKNVIGLGHFTSEFAGSLGAIYTAGRLAALNVYLMKTHPIATRLFLMTTVSISLNQTFQTLKKEYFSKPTPQEAVVIQNIERDMFKDVNKTLKQVLMLANMKLTAIDKQLMDPALTPEARSALLKDREDLQTKMQSLQKTLNRG